MAGSKNTRSLPVARRLLLGASVPLLCARPAPACPSPAAGNPDAELIRFCAEFDVLERKFISLFRGPNCIAHEEEREKYIMPIWEAQKPLVSRICELHATSIEGITARFQTLMLEDQDIQPEELLSSDLTSERMLGGFLRDFCAFSGTVRA